MKGIKGQLSSLPITDLMQWIDMNKKSGVLFVSNDASNKCFCFEEGRLLFAASNNEGGRLGDFLAKEGHVSTDALKRAISESKKGNAPLFAYMVENKVIPSEFLKVSVQYMAEQNIADILSWNGGTFEFIEDLPALVSKSPVKLSTNFIVFESVRRHDEELKKQGG